MKTFGIFLTLISAVAFIALSVTTVVGHYQFERDYLSSWNLADKSSTIAEKSAYIDKFVTTLETSNLQGQYNAILLTTPDNSFDLNLEALKSLQLRLKEIQTMNITSFEYQTAIQQITAQEQGEAHQMLGVFEGVWWKTNHFMLWEWVGDVSFIVTIVLLVIGILFWREALW